MKKFLLILTIPLLLFVVLATLTLNLAHVTAQTSDPGGAAGAGGTVISGCKPTAASPSYLEAITNALSCTLSGWLRVSVEAFNILLSAEDQPNSLFMVSGGLGRVVNVMTGITTNTTSATTAAVFSGGKTPQAKVTGTGAIHVKLTLFGAYDSVATNGIPLCVITLDGSTKVVGGCDGEKQFNQDWLFYYGQSEDISGTGATAELQVVNGATGSQGDGAVGSLINHHISVGVTEDETQVKATSGRMLWVDITNHNAAQAYFRCANLTAANNTPGTSPVFYGTEVPGSATGSGIVRSSFGPSGLAFSVALTCWVVTNAAESGVTEVNANEINWNIGYK